MLLYKSVPFETTQQFSSLFLDYINQKSELADFYGLYPTLSNFKTQIENKNFSIENRLILKDTLKKQYAGFQLSEATQNNIDSLSLEKTFTVTTGHQLCLFTGPLYFIYKIVSTIRLAQELKSCYPDYNFIPVYWMASEDHDFQEVNHFKLFGKKYIWQSEQKGAVGLFETNGLNSLFETLPESLPLFKKAYLEHTTLADATRFLVNSLFSSYGLLITDGNEHSFKQIFKPQIINELSIDRSFNVVNENNKKLENLGYSSQVHPREINLFYIDEGVRERIVEENNHFKILNTNLSFTKEEILKLADTNPEKFSPNVVLRPLFQELILPNLAYIGGPGEIAYWLQLADLFKLNQVIFPILVPRNFGLLLNKAQLAKLDKFGLQPENLFLADSELRKHYINSKNNTTWNEELFKVQIDSIINTIKTEATQIDKSLDGFMESQRNETHKILDNIVKKMRKTAELKEQEGINQVMNLKSKLFPEGNLQERNDNFLNFQIDSPNFIDELTQIFNPFKFEFNILITD